VWIAERWLGVRCLVKLVDLAPELPKVSIYATQRLLGRELLVDDLHLQRAKRLFIHLAVSSDNCPPRDNTFLPPLRQLMRELSVVREWVG